jgi:biotin transport system substrate-specific component
LHNVVGICGLIMSIYRLSLIPVFAALTAAGALIRVPMFPVPFTLQNLFVVMAGMVLGVRAGVMSQAVYLLMGLMGLPVFSGGGGPGYVMSPTFGYLLGFLAAPAVSGYLVQNRALTRLHAGVASLAGMLLIYLVGVPYLACYLAWVLDKPDAFSIALKTGFAVFLPGDVLKCLLLAVVMPRLAPALKMPRAGRD